MQHMLVQATEGKETTAGGEGGLKSVKQLKEEKAAR